MSFPIFGRTLGWRVRTDPKIICSGFLTLNRGLPMSEYLEYGVWRWSKVCRNHTNENSKANFPSSKGGSGCLKKCVPYIWRHYYPSNNNLISDCGLCVPYSAYTYTKKSDFYIVIWPSAAIFFLNKRNWQKYKIMLKKWCADVCRIA